MDLLPLETKIWASGPRNISLHRPHTPLLLAEFSDVPSPKSLTFFHHIQVWMEGQPQSPSTVTIKRSITHFWNQWQNNTAGWSRKQFTWPSTRGSVPAFPVVLAVGCWFAFSPERTISPSHLRFILQTGGHWLQMTGQAASKPKEDGLTSPEVKLGSLHYLERWPQLCVVLRQIFKSSHRQERRKFSSFSSH